MGIMRSLFMKPKNKRIADTIRIDSAGNFDESIRQLKKGGLSREEKRSLVLAQTRAKLQLRRENLSPRERIQFKAISKRKIPPVSKK